MSDLNLIIAKQLLKQHLDNVREVVELVSESSVKHLPGQHDQSTHGRGGGGIGNQKMNDPESVAFGGKEPSDEVLSSAAHVTSPAAAMKILDQGFKPMGDIDPNAAKEIYEKDGGEWSYFGKDRKAATNNAVGEGIVFEVDLRKDKDRSVFQSEMEGGLLLVHSKVSRARIVKVSVIGPMTPDKQKVLDRWEKYKPHFPNAKSLRLLIAKQLLTQARLAVELKAEYERPELRKAVVREIHIKQFEETEDEVGAALEPMFIAQIRSIADRLTKLDMPAEKSLAPVSDQAQSLIAQSFDPAEWQDDLVGRMLPVLAKKMLEAARVQLQVMGFDRKAVRKWRDKHLAGQHNQMTHGRGGGHPGVGNLRRQGDTAEGKGGKWVMEDGSDIPAHIPKNIPPAWKNVQIDLDPKAEMLVKGKDGKGRSQAVYSDAHWAKAAQQKFARINELRAKQEYIKKQIDQDAAKGSEEASCLRLVQATGMRPGGSGDTKAKKQAYGATTIEGRHIHPLKDGSVRLKYVGKKGVDRVVNVKDPVIAADLLARKEKAGPKGKVFDTSASKLSGYSHKQDGGGFKTKDFRTAKGTSTAIEVKSKMKAPKTEKEYKKAVKEVATKVAEQLGNTPTVALQSYIDPVVFADWRLVG